MSNDHIVAWFSGMAMDLPLKGEMAYSIVQLLTIVMSAIALAPALAHAFEFPGKQRLDRSAYMTVQTIYYPGFTLLGISEPGAIIAVIILLALTPVGTTEFGWTLVALLGLLGMQAVYWAFVHPVNRYWLQGAGVATGTAGRGFFGLEPAHGASGETHWKNLRDRWEYSHIARAALAFVSFFALVLSALRGHAAT
jgi:hypothetical protein